MGRRRSVRGLQEEDIANYSNTYIANNPCCVLYRKVWKWCIRTVSSSQTVHIFLQPYLLNYTLHRTNSPGRSRNGSGLNVRQCSETIRWWDSTERTSYRALEVHPLTPLYLARIHTYMTFAQFSNFIPPPLRPHSTTNLYYQIHIACLPFWDHLPQTTADLI